MKQSVLFNCLENENMDTLSLIGMAKNVGKTETLNHLIRHGEDKGRIFGVTSAGLDGEGKDFLTLGKKPLIWLPEKFLFATAETCLRKAGLKYELVEDSGFRNALGQIYVARVKEPGFVELAGPALKSGLKSVAQGIRSLGAEIVLIDGALDRMGAASSLVAKGTILCTGSALGGSMEQIVAQTGAKFEQLSLPSAPEEIINKYGAFSPRKIAFLDRDFQEIPLCLDTLVGNEKKILASLKKEHAVRYLVINGAVTQRFLDLVVLNGEHFQDVRLIIGSGNALFVDARSWDRYQRAQGRIAVCRPVHILGVSVNPYSPFGRSYGPKELILRLSARIKPVKPVPIVDVLSGYSL